MTRPDDARPDDARPDGSRPDDPRPDGSADPHRDWMGEPDGARPGPPPAARTRAPLPKRFYAQAGVEPCEGGFRLVLDGRPARTPARRGLTLPSPALAEAVATEWAAQTETIDPARMPLTRLANSAIDGVADRREAVAADIAAYAGTDLVAYRAAGPDRLAQAQAQAWDPVIAWAGDRFGARLILSEGVMHVTQPETTVAALTGAVEAVADPFRLAALHAMTTLTGSLLIALAVLDGHLDPAAAWEAAHVDESYQAEVWGVDAEAQMRLLARRAEFEAAALAARLA